MSVFFPGQRLPAGTGRGRAGGLGASFVVHAALVVLAVLGLGGATKELVTPVQTLAVRMVEAERPKPAHTPPNPTPVQRQPVRPMPVLASRTPLANAHFSVADTPVPEVLPAAPVVAVAAPAVAAPVVEKATEARFDADYLANPKPPYPHASRRLGEFGTVYLRVQVSEEGLALKVELKKSCGFERLDQSALDTVAHWRFVPARRGATPVTSWVVVPVVFSLT